MSKPALQRRRQNGHDDVSFAPPAERPREWVSKATRPHCRNGHRLNHIGTLDATIKAGELHIFTACNSCAREGARTYQFGHLFRHEISWYALPSEQAWDGFMDLIDAARKRCESLTTDMIIEIIRAQWNA